MANTALSSTLDVAQRRPSFSEQRAPFPDSLASALSSHFKPFRRHYPFLHGKVSSNPKFPLAGVSTHYSSSHFLLGSLSSYSQRMYHSLSRFSVHLFKLTGIRATHRGNTDILSVILHGPCAAYFTQGITSLILYSMRSHPVASPEPLAMPIKPTAPSNTYLSFS